MQFQQYGWRCQALVLQVSVWTNQAASRQKNMYRSLDFGSVCVMRSVDHESKRISEVTISSMREYNHQEYNICVKKFQDIFQVPHLCRYSIYLYPFYFLFMFYIQVLVSHCTRLKKLDLPNLRVNTEERFQKIEELIQNNQGITWFGATLAAWYYKKQGKPQKTIMRFDLFAEFRSPVGFQITYKNAKSQTYNPSWRCSHCVVRWMWNIIFHFTSRSTGLSHSELC